MSGIGSRTSAGSQGRVTELRYLNSPDFDPILATRLFRKVVMRGWAGNPFFHPFLWAQVFLFDLEYDDLGRIKRATPVRPDVAWPTSEFSEPLTFTWEGTSKRLLAISGPRYRREMNYDRLGRLVSERITHPKGGGRIEYRYRDESMQIVEVECEDDFFDVGRRTATIAALDR
jgi:hypothetical protein